MNYSDYFQIQHHPDEVSMDEFIAEAMRTDIRIENNQRTIDYLQIASLNGHLCHIRRTARDIISGQERTH